MKPSSSYGRKNNREHLAAVIPGVGSNSSAPGHKPAWFERDLAVGSLTAQHDQSGDHRWINRTHQPRVLHIVINRHRSVMRGIVALVLPVAQTSLRDQRGNDLSLLLPKASCENSGASRICCQQVNMIAAKGPYLTIELYTRHVVVAIGRANRILANHHAASKLLAVEASSNFAAPSPATCRKQTLVGHRSRWLAKCHFQLRTRRRFAAGAG